MTKTTKIKFYNTNWFMWIMLFLFAPVGIAILWLRKDVSFNKITKSILTLIFAIIFIISFASNINRTESNDQSLSTTTKIEDPVNNKVEEVEEVNKEVPSTIELTFEQQVEEISKKATGQDGLISLVWDDDSKKSITINLKMSDNLTKNMIKRVMILDAEKILEPLSKNETFKTLSHINIVHQTEFVDNLGNTSMGNAGIISIDVSTVMQIKWENFLTDNLPDICTSYYVHPSLNQ